MEAHITSELCRDKIKIDFQTMTNGLEKSKTSCKVATCKVIPGTDVTEWESE